MSQTSEKNTSIEYENYIEVLRKSTMFHMSLGSKELFHSNFLHWISIVNWGTFLKIMHKLAGLSEGEKFWWENVTCDVEGYKGNYCPDNNNIEVRREFHNFDLSIYILDSEVKHAKENQNANDKEGINKEDINTKGERIVLKWIPVLILENKMKSLPYEEQLERYTQKAFAEWSAGEIIKQKAKDSQGKELDNKYNITFILLSLMKTTLNNYRFESKKISQRPKYKLRLTSEWKHKTYDELLDSIKGIKMKPGLDTIQNLNQLVVEDYRKFVDALYNLASNCWKIDLGKGYRSQIYPWDKGNYGNINHLKITEVGKYKELRIHDIHEKLLYDQLLSELENRLQSEGLKYRRFDQKTILAQNKEQEPIRIYTNSGYAHGVGIFEVQYVLKLTKKKDEEIFRLIIQVQGDRYCHMLIYNDIVKEEGKKKSVKEDNLNGIWEENDYTNGINIENTLANYISIGGSKPTLLGIYSDKWGKYGQNLIYQYVEIPHNATIQDIIKAMVNDIKIIKGWFS